MLPVQCKMARVALGLGVRELAEAAKVSPDTIARLERGDALKDRTVEAIKAALETAGVIFVEENGEGPGVRMRKDRDPENLAETIEALDQERAGMEAGPSPKKALNRMKTAIAKDDHKKRPTKK